ncbi:MAG TPA: phosphatidylserine decarboxylase [Kiritimatiellia bacterium]|nr:phosphatidylserine decarboxylase [Kiritimatiellia bacterium]HMO98786.1 phosphatidylserine decarboxylase [Kiritimatiellia bacterium]HMP91086.1 phosphatidylserine decarboxylase [Kiritimatiellia bacterium]
MKIARGGWSHIAVGLLVGVVGGFSLYHQFMLAGVLLLIAGVLLTAFMVYFFRDPERVSPSDPDVVVSGADGWVRSVERISEARYLKRDTVRISVYLTPWDVHVNRVPVAGRVIGLDYTPGKHILTRNPQSSEVNEHSTIVIAGEKITCMVRQIVGPLVRRVKYWLELNQDVGRGDRLGIMKFGSRLDIYLPAEDVTPVVKAGDRVFAGLTVIARITKG